MIFLLFQLMDLLTAIVLIMAMFDATGWQILLYHGSYLIAKGAWYWKNWLSWFDILVGAYMLLMIIGVKTVFSYIAAAYFIYKFILFFVYS